METLSQVRLQAATKNLQQSVISRVAPAILSYAKKGNGEKMPVPSLEDTGQAGYAGKRDKYREPERKVTSETL